MDIFETSERNATIARQILQDTNVIGLWQAIGAQVNQVGSLKSGLIMKHLDIDLHIYTDDVIVADSFAAVAKLAENPCIIEITYRNLIDTEEECIEWHAGYIAPDGNRWELDMIHIRRGSKFDGYVERVTDGVIRLLTPETRRAILQVKANVPEGVKVAGLEVYRAVLADGVRSYPEFAEWKKLNPIEKSYTWIP